MDGLPKFDKAFMQKIVGARAVKYMVDHPNGSTSGFMESHHLLAAVQAYKREIKKFEARDSQGSKQKKN